LWRYIARADQLIAESCRASRRKLLRRHLAQRRNLFAKALSAGDYRAALAAARDEAELEGLYAPKRVEHTGKGGGPLRFSLEEAVAADRELEEWEREHDPDGTQPDGSEPAAPRDP
jgi:hypothetical protein